MKKKTVMYHLLLFAVLAVALCSIHSDSLADISSGWLWPVSPSIRTMFRGYTSSHGAIDIDHVGIGTTIYASKAGQVIAVYDGCNKSYTGSSDYSSCTSSTCNPVAKIWNWNTDTLYTTKSGIFTSCTMNDHTYNRCNYGYGRGVIIRHEDGGTAYFSCYAHMDTVAVSAGQRVSQGQVIGTTGAHGNAFGAHLHFAIGSTGSVSTYPVQNSARINNNPNSPDYHITSTQKTNLSVSSDGYVYNTSGVGYIFSVCPAAPTPVVTCSDQYHSVDITWAETTGQDFYSLRLYDASGETRIYLRDYIQHTAYSALLLQPGNYWAEVATVVENVQVNTSTKVPFTVTAGTLPDMPSPLSWRIADGKLFRLYPVGGTWLTDKALAAQAGGHLAYITNQTRQNAIFEMVSAAGQWAYLGGHGHYYTWQWLNSTVLASGYTNWAANKPDNWEGTENVLMMYPSDGTWEDVPNSYTPYYVVEFDPVSLDLSFYQPSWGPSADQIRDNVSVGVTFSDGTAFYVDDFGLSYVESDEEITVTVTWGGLSATDSVSVIDNPPEITSCWIENVDNWGYDVCATATDDNGVAYYVFGTWHDPQTIDDAFWETVAAEEDGSIRYHVDIANYDYAADVNYYTRVIVFDTANSSGEAEYDASAYVEMLDLFEQRNGDLTMTLPAALTTIEEGAFQNVAAQYFVLSPNVTAIESNAFPENAVVYLYGSSIETLGPDLFGGGPGIFVEMGEADRWLMETFDGTEVSYVLRNSVVPKLWGEWSEWSTDPVEADENTQVETKTEYRTRGISYATRYTDWSAWSSWSLTAQAIPDANLKQQRTQLVYPYYCFICPTCGWHSAYWGTGKCTNGHNISSHDFDINVYNITTPKSGCTVVGGKYRTVYNGEYWYYWDDGSDPDNQTVKTEYSYRTRTAYQEAVYTDWSEWSDTPAVATATLEVETRLLYHHRTKN